MTQKIQRFFFLENEHLIGKQTQKSTQTFPKMCLPPWMVQIVWDGKHSSDLKKILCHNETMMMMMMKYLGSHLFKFNIMKYSFFSLVIAFSNFQLVRKKTFEKPWPHFSLIQKPHSRIPNFLLQQLLKITFYISKSSCYRPVISSSV